MEEKPKKISPFWYLRKKQTKHGLRSLAYKKGKIVNSEGYVLIFSPNHPHRNNRNYVYEHRLVIEKNIARYLTSEEVVHHINECRSDNRIENLRVFSSSSVHTKHHNRHKRK